MKYIQVPEDIQLMLNGELLKDSRNEVEKPWPFIQYLRNIVLADPAVGTDYDNIRSSEDILSKFKNTIPGTWIELAEPHWEMLESTIRKPKGGGISPDVLRQLLPFMEAVLDAKRKKPTEVTIDVKDADSKAETSRKSE